jgi:hypothetical protein
MPLENEPTRRASPGFKRLQRSTDTRSPSPTETTLLTVALMRRSPCCSWGAKTRGELLPEVLGESTSRGDEPTRLSGFASDLGDDATRCNEFVSDLATGATSTNASFISLTSLIGGSTAFSSFFAVK